jgi:hypothetical protein
MSIKATSLLSIVAIWVATITAVVIETDAWWSIIFAALATGAVGALAWRRLGLSRLIAIAGIWAGTAIGMASEPDATWISIFAFLSTGAVVYSIMRRVGLGIAFAWLVVGSVIAINEEPDAAWISIFAFLTAGAVANNRTLHVRGVSAILWWGIAGGVMLAADGWYWLALAVPAFLLSAAALGFSDWGIPRRFEWDLFDRDDDSEGDVRYV